MVSDLLDIKEGADFIHVPVSTLRDWILKEKITYVKLGRRVFFRRQDLEKLIADSVVPVRGEGVRVEAR